MCKICCKGANCPPKKNIIILLFIDRLQPLHNEKMQATPAFQLSDVEIPKQMSPTGCRRQKLVETKTTQKENKLPNWQLIVW